MPRMTGSRYFAEAMRGYGVTHVFYVNSVARQALDEMNKTGVTRVVTHGEKAAAYMADGYAGPRPAGWHVPDIGTKIRGGPARRQNAGHPTDQRRKTTSALPQPTYARLHSLGRRHKDNFGLNTVNAFRSSAPGVSHCHERAGRPGGHESGRQRRTVRETRAIHLVFASASSSIPLPTGAEHAAVKSSGCPGQARSRAS